MQQQTKEGKERIDNNNMIGGCLASLLLMRRRRGGQQWRADFSAAFSSTTCRSTSLQHNNNTLTSHSLPTTMTAGRSGAVRAVFRRVVVEYEQKVAVFVFISLYYVAF